MLFCSRAQGHAHVGGREGCWQWNAANEQTMVLATLRYWPKKSYHKGG